MTCFDSLLEANADDECRLWIRRLIDAKDEIVDFVDSRLDGQGTGQYLGAMKGSFNLSFHIGLGPDRPSVLIRFAKPGHTKSEWRAEKVKNEVRVIEYLREHTTLPLPNVRCWGLSEDSPQGLGPFINMDYIEGTRLSSFLREPTDDEAAEMTLNPEIEEPTLDKIYEQIADFMLQLSKLRFPRIGAISHQESSQAWAVTGRPLTFNMNELATMTGYPTHQFPTNPFDSARHFFEAVANQHLVHLDSQRNLCPDEEDVWRRFVARHRFKQLISRYCVDTPMSGQYPLFCDDMQPANMLIDTDTLRITAVIDLEFTSSMPAQFVEDPPWWLLLRGPDLWLERFGKEEFLARYVPRMKQYLRALERVEAKSTASLERPELVNPVPLSTRMRESWETGRFWFNCASRTSLDVDDIYWIAMHDQAQTEDGLDLLDAETKAELDPLINKKMDQDRAYGEEFEARFGDKNGLVLEADPKTGHGSG